jgi:mRNA interferase MazF
MAKHSDYRMGSIWIVTFDPSVGTKIQKTRPAVIISGTLFNNQRSKVTVLPFTSAKPKITTKKPCICSHYLTQPLRAMFRAIM